MVRRNKWHGLLGDLTVDLLSSLERRRSDPREAEVGPKVGHKRQKVQQKLIAQSALL